MKFFCTLIMIVGICFSGCSKTPFRKTYEVPVAHGKNLQVYVSGETIFFEWQGDKTSFTPPEGERVIGLAADEQNRLFVFTQKTGFAPVQAGRLQDGRFYQIALFDMPRDLFTANLDRYSSRRNFNFLEAPLDFLLSETYNAKNQTIYDATELWEARFPSPKVGEDSVSLLKAQYREVDLPWPEWIETITPESFAIWGDDNPTLESQLFWLTSTDLVGQAGKLLDAKVDVDCRTPGGRTPLMNAALHGNLEMMSLLLDHGADLEAENYNGETALYYAIYGHSEDAVRFLEFEMSDIHHQNRFRENVLMTAIMTDPKIAFFIFWCEQSWGYGHHKPLRRVKLKEMNRYLEFSEHKRPWQEMRLVKQTNLAGETILHYLGRTLASKPDLFELLETVLHTKPFPRPHCDLEQKDFAEKTALFYVIKNYYGGRYAYEGYDLRAIKMLHEFGADFKSHRDELLQCVNPRNEHEKPLHKFLMDVMNEESSPNAMCMYHSSL